MTYPGPEDCVALVRVYTQDYLPHAIVAYLSGSLEAARCDAEQRFSDVYDRESGREWHYRVDPPGCR